MIQDPDPLINCEFMNGRENFLLFSRENHLEFSTLRRAKFSSLVLLHELIYSKNEKKIIYICNRCKCNIETRYHCLVCAVSFNIEYFLVTFFVKYFYFYNMILIF